MSVKFMNDANLIKSGWVCINEYKRYFDLSTIRQFESPSGQYLRNQYYTETPFAVVFRAKHGWTGKRFF